MIDAQCCIGTSCQHDAIAAIVFHQYTGHTSGNTGNTLQMLNVDAFFRQTLLREITKAVIADCTDKADIRTLTGSSHRLIGAFAAGNLTELMPQQGFSHCGHARCAEH